MWLNPESIQNDPERFWIYPEALSRILDKINPESYGGFWIYPEWSRVIQNLLQILDRSRIWIQILDMIGSSRAATQSLAKTTKVYRNRGVDIGSFNILIRLRTVQIGFYRVHLPLGSMPEKHRSKKSFLSRRTVKLIIGRKKFIFFGKSQNSIGIWRTPFITFIKGVPQIPIEFGNFPTFFDFFWADDHPHRSPW